jgi:predicted ferric reductase
MKQKGILIILLSVVITIGLWLGSKWFYNDWFSDSYKYLSKFSALTATIFFSWSMILSARFKKIEVWFGGLDKVYTAHKWLGIGGFLMIMLHPLILALNKLPDIGQFVGYFGIRNFDTIQKAGFNLGLAASVLLISLFLMIQNSRIPYHIWKRCHEYMNLFYFIGIGHILLVNADISKYPLLGVWMYSWFVFSTFCGIYTKFLYPRLGPRFKYQITKVEKYNDMVEITMLPTSKKILKYDPGQFAFVKFLNSAFDGESHPYSIACSPNEKGIIKFGIKILGDDTQHVLELSKGEPVIVYGPYGNLGEKFLRGDKDCVCIGGGIGITPFLSIWDEALNHTNLDHKNNPKVHLFYSVKCEDEAICDDDIKNSMIQSHINCEADCILRGHSYALHNAEKDGFLNATKIENKVGDLKNKYFFLCGPKPMTNSLIKQLREKGVKNSQITVEEFDMRHVNIDWIYYIFGIKR